MDITQFDYHLPEELIAQSPLKDRTASKLFLLEQSSPNYRHETFDQIIHYLQPGDCLVLNNSKVIPVRLFGVKEITGAKMEILLLHETEEKDRWKALVKPARKLKQGDHVQFGDGLLRATCMEELEEGARLLQLDYQGVLYELLDQLGEMPLPPYIKEDLEDADRYQTVYAKEKGSAAAPTAGLHFSQSLLEALKKKGVEIAYVTLHVGLGTFRPISVSKVSDHTMHAEYYEISAETAQLINKTKRQGGKLIAVGTTTTRVLETVAQTADGELKAASGWTDIFIYPPYQFQVVDGLITNFHLPKSSLLLLISALTSRTHILQAYEEAIRQGYRFFSFGDAMFILPKGRYLE